MINHEMFVHVYHCWYGVPEIVLVLMFCCDSLNPFGFEPVHFHVRVNLLLKVFIVPNHNPPNTHTCLHPARIYSVILITPSQTIFASVASITLRPHHFYTSTVAKFVANDRTFVIIVSNMICVSLCHMKVINSTEGGHS